MWLCFDAYYYLLPIKNVLQYVLEELNIRSLVPCNDPLKYASLRAEPDFRYIMSNLFSLKTVSLCCCSVLALNAVDCFLIVY